MIRKGEISSVNLDNRTARVTFRDLDNAVTPEIPCAKHVTVSVNDIVAVSFFSENMADGLILGVF
ncbi:hypothetical protein E0485_21825 [Paenibacillus albiflavus]|uniref:Uncharacterized protein n=1 Tax=Paenibacillus albiflavus TaxID=2545760 RepID=A0A4R4E344_9BACL|nr:hypothetical protein [Paenibacillus albiflavus]TCZ73060.1 hypothetical protein E0485_21825 [Paenibacillus albiflavus]